MKYLLDTCVISELIKKIPKPKVIEWLRGCDEEHLYLSVLTLGEIQKGISKLTDHKRKQRIQFWLDNELGRRFAGRVLVITEEIATIWGTIQAESEIKGMPVPTIDGLLAATAKANNLILATLNSSDVERTGVKIFNPWES